jgi:nitrite reductase/ring-hydroxylating ferredoxin subunit
MAWTSAMKLSELKKVGRQTIGIESHQLLLIWHENALHVVQAKCPHLGMSLLKGKIDEQCHLVCPFHKSTFDLKTGDVGSWSPWPPVVAKLLGKMSKPKSLKIYEARVENDEIMVLLPTAEVAAG